MLLSSTDFVGHFNPRSREGSDFLYPTIHRGIYQISIRAPARGATRYCLINRSLSSDISIRAPARGATITDFGIQNMCMISIRAPARGATDHHSFALIQFVISIRAPARGATRQRQKRLCRKLFQSALPRGERPQ